MHSNFVSSNATTTLAQQGTFAAYLATKEPQVIDSSATDHMIGTSGLLFDLAHSSSLPNVTLADGSATTVSGFGTTNLNSNLSLSLLLYIPVFQFNLL